MNIVEISVINKKFLGDKKMTLAKDEVVIKKWDYVQVEPKSLNMKKTLEVTNKRVVHTIKGDSSLLREEVAIDAIQSISYKNLNLQKKVSNFGQVLIGAILFACGIVLLLIGALYLKEFLPSLLGVALALLSLLLLVSKKVEENSFLLEIKVGGVANLCIKEGNVGILGNKIGARKDLITIAIDKNAVAEIMDTLGAIIIENK